MKISNLFKRKQALAERTSKGENAFLWILCIFFLIYTVTLFYPVFWTIINSFKTTKNFFKDIYGMPQEWIWKNYVDAFDVKVGKANIVEMLATV